MIFTLTKTTCSQRGELFAKSDFHESIRLNAKVLYLRNSESCNLSRSVHLARRAMYTERSLRAATRFFAANQQKKLKEKCPTFQIKVSSLRVRRASYFRRLPLFLFARGPFFPIEQHVGIRNSFCCPALKLQPSS